MTDSPSDNGAAPESSAAEGDGREQFTAELAAAVGADRWTVSHGTPKLFVDRTRWVEAVSAARDAGLDFFSWLSAVDWAADVAVGEPVENPDEVEERFELLACLSTTTNADLAVLSTTLPKDDAAVDTISGVFGGADWHERETHEMFGIDFRGHPKLLKLYLPDAFEGFPLRKDYALLSREVKPWPGTVDVEDMPSTENTEAGDAGAETDGGEDE